MKSEALAIFILFFLFRLPAVAQATADTMIRKENASADSSYIRYYDKYLNVTTGWNTKNTEYLVSYPRSHTKFLLSPKETNQFYVSLDYSFLYAYYSFTPHL